MMVARRMMLLLLFFIAGPLNDVVAKDISTKTKDVPPGERKLTEKESAELNKYKKQDALITPLRKTPNAPKFDKETLYVMKNFKIIQKISGGYLITTDPVVWTGSAHSMDFGVAFLKTSKTIPQDVLITGAVVYDGEYKYTSTNGFEQKVPRIKIPANLPISGFHQGGDPFKPELF